MGLFHKKTIMVCLCMIFALATVSLPVTAQNGTISIAYRGAGGNYLGDAIIFDGYNSVSNVTLLRLTGPGLPAEGVPIYDMNGKVGTGNTVPVKPDNSWKYIWYTSSIKGAEKLETARYYITAFDLTDPKKTATTSILLKKAEFYVIVTPNQAGYGEYIQLTGIAEKGSSSVHFDIAGEDGKIVHAYDTTVSASGYFNKGFHVDMPPGVYTITLSTPSAKTTYRNYLTVQPGGIPSNGTVTTTPGFSPEETPTAAVPQSTPEVSTPSAEGTGSLSITSTPPGSSVFLDSVSVGSTPLELNAVPAGNHLLEIRAPGYLTYSVQVWVKNGETMAISPVLLRNPSPTPVSIITVIAGLFISFAVVIAVARRRRN